MEEGGGTRFDGQIGTVTMTNKSERPVEVYALDFDPQYLEEEEMLTSRRTKSAPQDL